MIMTLHEFRARLARGLLHGGAAMGLFLGAAGISAQDARDPIGNEAVYSGIHRPGTLEDSFEVGEVPPEYADDLESPWHKMRLARQLAAQGRPAVALENLLWCYDQGAEKYPEFVFALKGQLPALIAALGQNYEPAITALKARGAGLREKITANPKGAKPDVAEQLAAIDVALLDEVAILDTIDVLPEKGRARQAYGDIVRPLLIARQHYQQAVSLGSLEADFGRRRAEMLRRSDELRENTRGNPKQMLAALQESTAMVGALYVEALAGVKDSARAQKLMRDVLKVSDAPRVRAALERGLRRAGADELADSLSAAK